MPIAVFLLQQTEDDKGHTAALQSPHNDSVTRRSIAPPARSLLWSLLLPCKPLHRAVSPHTEGNLIRPVIDKFAPCLNYRARATCSGRCAMFAVVILCSIISRGAIPLPASFIPISLAIAIALRCTAIRLDTLDVSIGQVAAAYLPCQSHSRTLSLSPWNVHRELAKS